MMMLIAVMNFDDADSGDDGDSGADDDDDADSGGDDDDDGDSE